jgi:hypothetical protein
VLWEIRPLKPREIIADFEAAALNALQQTDQYVWIYTETPRWWSEDGKPVKLPSEYAAALRQARLPKVSPN